MPLNRKKTIKIISIIILILIVALLLIVAMKGSNYGSLKKYDTASKPKQMMGGFTSSHVAKSKVTIVGDGVANLGEFTFSLSDDRWLEADISVKYRSHVRDNSLFGSSDKTGNELIVKSDILRDAAITTMLGDLVDTANSDKIKESLKETLNKKLYNGEIEEVYFNKFIIK